jgi:hypothetical protein
VALTNIVDCDLDAIRIGQRVRLVFEPSEGGPPIPMFAPARAGEDVIDPVLSDADGWTMFLERPLHAIMGPGDIRDGPHKPARVTAPRRDTGGQKGHVATPQ